MSDLSRRISELSPEKKALLARKLREKREKEARAQRINRRENLEKFPLSFAQQRLWFLDQFTPGSTLYNIAASVRMTGPLDVAVLERSFTEIARRHETMRAIFCEAEGEPQQVILPELPVSLPVIDLQGLPADEQKAEAARLAGEEARTPFDLAEGPLIRGKLLRLAPDEHVILLTLHHIIYDGWSTNVLLKELAALYLAFSSGQPSPLPELSIQYADFAAWQREWLQGEALDEQLGYWRERLAGAPPLLELPTDHPRPAVQTYDGALYTLDLPTGLTEPLNALAREHDATLFMVLLAAFQVLLSRASGQTDISVGTPVAGRRRSQLENLMGFFVNTLVMRTDLSGGLTFEEALARVKETALSAFAHQDLPFEMLVEKLQPERNLSYSPFFQVLFDLGRASWEDVTLNGGLTLSVEETDTQTAKFDLSLLVLEGKDHLSATFEYNTDLFDASTIERMAGHYVTLLQGIVEDAAQPIAMLPLLTEAEREQIFYEWNDTAFDYPHHLRVADLLDAQAERTPDVPAVLFGDDVLTYRELHERANRLARVLQARGAGPDVPVGLCVERSAEMVVAMLAILKAGGGYLPLDPNYPSDRLNLMANDAELSVLITEAALEGKIEREGMAVVRLDADRDLIDAQSADPVASAAEPQHLGYILYTSGSTGVPKGVQIEQRSVVNFLYTMQDRPGMTADDIVMAITTISFDIAAFEILLPLTVGARLVVITTDDSLDTRRLAALADHYGATIMQATPTRWRMMIESGWQGGPDLTVICGGEAVTRELATDLLQRCGTLWNGYGPTETTVYSSYFHIKEVDERSISIGTPVGNTQIYLLDGSLQLVPAGVPGELYIGGDGMARGYRNRPETTAERFLPHPFDDDPSARIYKTGDLARWRTDGNIEYLGRADHQVKVRGFRIELGEIEAVLKEHIAVEDAAALAREDTPGDKRLVGYVVARDGSDLTAEDLREFLGRKLPDYMVPAMYVFLDAMPMTPNEKIDRKALPAPTGDVIEMGVEVVAPRTPTEEVLAGLFARMLNVEQVGIYHDFFDMGGHSLLATQLVSRVREAFGVDLPLRALFEHSTVAGLAEAIDAVGQRAAVLTPIEPVDRREGLPLSFAQQRLWFLDQFEPNRPFYNLPFAIRLTGALDVDAFEASLNEIAARHEALRTTFPTFDGRPRQIVAPKLSLPLPLVDLTHVDADQREVEARRLAEQEARRPFNLATGPLLRVRLFRLAKDEHLAVLVMHHIISDGWSAGVLVSELAALYPAFAAGETIELPPGLPPLPVQYADYAAWQRGWLSDDVLDEQLDYWKQQLAGVPPMLELPTDRPRPAVQSNRGAVREFELPADLSESLHDLSRGEGVTLFMVLLAAFQTLLARYTGQDDISVGTPIAGRSRSEIEPLIGFFVNTLVMRADLSADEDGQAPTFRELLKQVRETALGAYAHQDVPFEMLVDALQPDRNMSHTPLFQAMFAMQRSPIESQELPGLAIEPVFIDSGTAKFDMTLSVVADEDALGGMMEYSADLFDASTIDRMLGHYEQLLRELVAAPDAPVSTMPLLTEPERVQILDEWNQTALDYDTEHCLHEVFEMWAERTPDAEAVVYGNDSLTFAELDERANKLAHALRRRGVGPEVLAGLAIERSTEMIVGLLGILKAGGAYLPLDPTYPLDRLAFMLEDTAAPVLVTRSDVVGSLPTDGIEVICLDTDWPEIERESAEPVTGTGVTPSSLAYIIYTSGSTGLPKGAMIEHRSAQHLAAGLDHIIYSTLPDRRLRISLNAPLSFDASVQQLVMMLTRGHTLVVVPQEVRGDGALLRDFIHEQHVELVDCVPSQLKLALAAGLLTDGGWAPLAMLPGGEAIDEATWSALRAAPATEFFNMYGPTECTVDSTIGRVKTCGPTPTIGRPITNARLYILNAQMQPQPVGVPGELFIGGAGVGRGYLNRPELTAERFLPDPFSGAPDARMYKTGDLVRWLPDGHIEFLGRTDHQVKVRGFRIELGEIEEALRRLPIVKDAVVLAREDEPGHKRLVGYVVTQTTEALPIGELRAGLAETLPDYMVPSVFVFLDALPLTPNSKVDRKALPEPSTERPELESEYTAPQNDVEQTLAAIWSGVLGVERIGVHDNFFELGGDSILTIQVVARANQAGLRLSPRQVFEFPTVSGLAQVAGRGPAVQAEQGAVEGPVPLTPIQRWFFEQKFPDRHHWNQSVLLETLEPLEPALLRRAVLALLQHHDALRLRFKKGVAGWEQENVGEGGEEDPFLYYDLSQMEADEQQGFIAIKAEEIQESLDIKFGPLMRVAYFDRGVGRSGRLLFVVHHLAVDGVSWRVLLEDFRTVYEQGRLVEAMVLPPKTTSFKQWAERLLDYAQTEDARADGSYWLNMDAESAAELPVDHPDGDNREAALEVLTTELTAGETTALLRDVPAAYGTEIHEALLAALASAFREWTGSTRLLVALEGHGREDLFEDIDLSRTVGWFTSMYPVLLDAASLPGPGARLKAVKEQVRAVPRRGVGYGLLRYLSQDAHLRDDLAALPEPQIAFNYLGQFDQLLAELPDYALSGDPAGRPRSALGPLTHLLSVNGGIGEGCLRMEWSYAGTVFERETVQQVADAFGAALREIIAHCQQEDAVGYTPSDFADADLSQDELDVVLMELDDTL